MKTLRLSRIGSRAAALAAIIAGLGAFAGPAAAQGTGVLPLRVKLGVHLPEDSGTHFNGEVDFVVPTMGAGQTVLTAGYSEGSKNGRKLRVVPLTVARIFSPPNPVAGVTGNVYFGLGAGAYLLRVSGGGVSESKTQFGGFGIAGYQFPNAFFIEGKYHIAGKIADVSPNGIAILPGRRF